MCVLWPAIAVLFLFSLLLRVQFCYQALFLLCYMSFPFVCFVWSIQVCDFGLSRFKANTFLSSKSAAGTVSAVKLNNNNNNMTESLFQGGMGYSLLKYVLNNTSSNLLAWVDGTWSSPRWTFKWEVWRLQLWCNLVGASNIAATLEQFKSSTGLYGSFIFDLEMIRCEWTDYSMLAI